MYRVCRKATQHALQVTPLSRPCVGAQLGYVWCRQVKGSTSVQGFVVARTKKCDGCRYCVQTDKTGKRPLANLPVSYNGRELRLCPYFPGYSYCWTALSDGLVDDMITMLGFMDVLFEGT